MKNRGYTLIELLGVIVLLALLTTLVFPSVINTIKKSNNELDENALKLVSTSADIYIKNNKELFPRKNGNKFSIDVNKLIDNANLSSKIKLSSGDKIEDKCIQTIYKNGKFTYEIKDKGTCINEEYFTCKPVDEDTVTTGNIPEGKFNNGDEYICEVKDNTFYHFFVISTSSDKVSLIMNRNICDDGSFATEDKNCSVKWITQEDFILEGGTQSEYGEYGNNNKGPISALNLLEKATENWINVNNILIDSFDSYDGSSKKTKTYEMKNYNLRARMPCLTEVLATGCSTGGTKCPIYMIDYMANSTNETPNTVSGIHAYWTITSSEGSKDYVYPVRWYGFTISISLSNDIIGVRPVIEVDKEYIYVKRACTLISGRKNTIGSKYECEVKTGTKYNFYVLSQESDGTTNLIMDRNICNDGTPATENNKCTIEYNSSGDVLNVGPVTVMNYLNQATSTWENIDNLDLTYDDENDNFANFKVTGKARLPYLSETIYVGCENYSELSCPVWMVDYLHSEVSTYQKNPINNIYGYWTFSSIDGPSCYAFYVDSRGYIDYFDVNNGNDYGVRPVINVKLN